MPMRATTVRFSEDLWGLLEAEAGRQGTSAAQLVRDATIMRLAFTLAQRGDPQAELDLDRLLDRLHERRPGRPIPLPAPDPKRVATLRRAALLDRTEEPAFDRLTAIAARVLRAPTAVISLIGDDRQLFKSAVGLPEPWATTREAPLAHSLCAYAVSAREPLILPDAREHPAFKDNTATAQAGLVAYAGIPLILSDGSALGALCAYDYERRAWSADQVALLSDVAALVVQEIERRNAP
jgi:hypothetical protein